MVRRLFGFTSGHLWPGPLCPEVFLCAPLAVVSGRCFCLLPKASSFGRFVRISVHDSMRHRKQTDTLQDTVLSQSDLGVCCACLLRADIMAQAMQGRARTPQAQVQGCFRCGEWAARPLWQENQDGSRFFVCELCTCLAEIQRLHQLARASRNRSLATFLVDQLQVVLATAFLRLAVAPSRWAGVHPLVVSSR